VIFIDPVAELGGLLLNVDKCARYVGGEYGILSNKNKMRESSLRAIIAFPDLYEIGMGNLALKIIYNKLNHMEGICCDRVFAPAPDFENLLREKKIPLYGLDTGIAIGNADVLLFTLGYELGLSGVFSILDRSFLPLRCKDRGEGSPIAIAGGPAVSNPLPFSPFIDAFWIGEAEAGFFDLAEELSNLRKEGKGRAELLEKISAHPNIWVTGKENVKRAIYSGFSTTEEESNVFPIPGMKIVQNHGSVEIMRGCPNGCRFCHAGFWYRPMRQKNNRIIINQVNDMVTKGGWHEISLSSLSSGDYNGIGELVENLNKIYKDKRISFQLPSLKVSGFSLNLLEKISVTRKSGITFAVETPRDLWQMAINKEVTRNSVISILTEAKKRGWKSAKFYFMIGLPKPEADDASDICEEQEITDFIIDVGRKTKMHFNINVGIFVPKPHTPYQNVIQLDSEEAAAKMDFIRTKLKPHGHKVSVSDPLISRLEGLLSRGDENAGLMVEEAFLAGSRLEAWHEFINKDKWVELLKRSMNDVIPVLPWACIDSFVSYEYLMREMDRSCKGILSTSCKEKCNNCGVCGKDVKVFYNTPEPYYVNQINKTVNEDIIKKGDPDIYRMLFSFSKTGSAVFHGHLSLIEILSMAFTRAEIPVKYTQGFNPIPKMEIASSLSTGISADNEIAIVDFEEEFSGDKFLNNLNKSLPEGIYVNKAECFYIPSGMKKHSLSSLLWGFTYAVENGKEDYVKAIEEKPYRLSRLGTNDKASVFLLRRTSVLAKNITANNENEHISYFNAYSHFYPLSAGRQNIHYE
jgi:radical SAM superfamily enzyme YgiQ (UPF0313 family)